MANKKIKIRAFFRAILVIFSLSGILFFTSANTVSALSLNDSVVATSNAPGINCSVNLNPLTWLICPIISGMQALVDGFDTYITSELTINTCTYFNSNAIAGSNGKSLCGPTGDVSNGFYTAWSNLRNIALGIMVIGALVMVISQIMGFELFDAYTIRKVLPRLVIAAIGISLSWQLVQFLIQFSNDLGSGLSFLIYQPFTKLMNGGGASGIVIGGGTSSAAALLGVGAIGSLGLIGSLTFVLVAALAAFLGFVVIILRQILVVFLALLAPIAIAMFILPGTAKVWKLWWNTFFKALLMFPLIVGIIAIGRVFAAISSQNGSLIGQFIAFIAYFGPYFIIPSTFKFAGGILGAAGGVASKANKSFGRSMAVIRSGRRKTIHQNRMEGNTKFGSGKSGDMYRRIATGSIKPTAKGRSDFQALNQQILAGSAKKRLEQDAGAASGDDIATGLALQSNMTGRDFISQYANSLAGKDEKTGAQLQPTSDHVAQATTALSTIEKNFGARIGSSSMQVAAFKARSSSVSAYAATPEDPNAGLKELYQDGGNLIRNGLISSTAATQAVKANKARPDISAASFGDIKNQFESTAQSGQNLSIDQANDLKDSALRGAGPGEFIGAHANSVKSLAPRVYENLNKAVTAGDQKQANIELAKIDNIYMALGQGSPKNAQEFSEDVLTKPVRTSTGQVISVREAIELSRNNTDFKNIKAGFGPMPGGSPAGGPGDKKT